MKGERRAGKGSGGECIELNKNINIKTICLNILKQFLLLSTHMSIELRCSLIVVNMALLFFIIIIITYKIVVFVSDYLKNILYYICGSIQNKTILSW